MSKKISKPLSIAIGVAMVGGLTAVGSASAGISADENPFAMEELRSGYLMAGSHKEGGCGEGKCGEDKKKDAEGSCGEDKGAEGSCGENKGGEDKGGEGKCGGSA
jgi:uncharacterized low-complexity protein